MYGRVYRDTTAYKNFRDIVWRRKRKEDSRPIDGVCYSNIVRDVWKDGFRVLLDVVDYRLVVCDYEDPAIGKGKSTAANISRNINIIRETTHRGNKLAGKLLSKNAEGRTAPLSLGGKNSKEFSGSML